MRFLAFLLVLLLMTLCVLYVLGDRQTPQRRETVQEVELRPRRN